jgi:hypothetical protein
MRRTNESTEHRDTMTTTSFDRGRAALPGLMLGAMLAFAPIAMAAPLTPYQESVVAEFAGSPTEPALRAAYEAVAAGKATPAQRNVIRTSEIIVGDRTLGTCVLTSLTDAGSLDAIVKSLVAAGRGPAILADVRAEFTAAEFADNVAAQAPAAEQAISAMVLLAASARPDGKDPAADLKALRRRMLLNYELSYATKGKCIASPEHLHLLGKDKP